MSRTRPAEKPSTLMRSAPGLETARVFFALWPPPEVARRLAGIAREQAARHGGKATRADVVQTLRGLLEGIGKITVLCVATPGYIVPRIQALAMNEAAAFSAIIAQAKAALPQAA